MLHLAEYGSSDDDEEEVEKAEEPKSGILSLLPKPSLNISIRKANDEDELDELVTKKRKWESELSGGKPVAKKHKGPVKISLPEIVDGNSSDEDEEAPRPRREANSASSLISMLPTPKNAKSDSKSKAAMVEKNMFMPPQVSIKKCVNISSVTPKPSPLVAKSTLLTTDYASDDDEEVGSDGGDFFRLDSKDTVETLDLVDNEFSGYSSNQQESFSTPTASMHPSQMYNYANLQESDIAGPSNGDVRFDDVRRIIYKHEIQSSGDDNVQLPDDLPIFEVSVDSQLGNYRENMLKNITDRSQDKALEAARLAISGVKKKKPDKPAQQAKRKHQITYLAHLAKEREESLKNEWAANRYSKRETQMKYGF